MTAPPPLLLFHGSGLGPGSLRRLGVALTRHGHSPLAIPLVGYDAARPFDDATWQTADDLRCVTDAVAACPSPAVLFGHSYGGLLALAAAADRPLAIRGVVAYEPVAFGVLPTPSREHAALAADPRFRDPETGGGEAWLRRFTEYWHGAGAWDALPEPSRRAQLAVGRKLFREVTAFAEATWPLDRFRALRAPTLLLHGEHTRPEARDVCHALATLPGAREQQLPLAGHLGPLTHADAVAEAVAAFVAQLPDSPQ